jgi:hypothetical protein
MQYFPSGGLSEVRSAGSYLRWMDSYYDYARSSAGRDELAFWDSFPRDGFLRARAAFPTVKSKSARMILLNIPSVMAAALRMKCQHRLRCKLAEALIAAILPAIGHEFNLDELSLNWTSHGRFPVKGESFSNTAGWLSSRYPLLIPKVTTGKTDLLTRLRPAFQGIPLMGSGFCWVTRFGNNTGESDLSYALHSPFTINVREATHRASVCAPPLSRNLAEPPRLTILPSIEWIPISEIYVVIDIGLTTSLSLTCVEDGTSLVRAERIMNAVALNLYQDAFSDGNGS